MPPFAPMENEDVVICRDPEDLSREGAERIVRLAQESVSHTGRFAVALSGGSTPRGLYARLATSEFRGRISWEQVFLFWGDERCVPPDHPESNYRMVREVLLSKVSVLPENIFRMAGEKEPEVAAAEYDRILKSRLALSEEGFPRLDLVLLGLGEDGHTASLFHGSEALRETRRLVVANYVEALRAFRLTLTFPVLNAGANVFFFVAGKDKAAILRDIFTKKSATDTLPAQRVRPERGRLVWLMDREAATLLQNVKT